jgi:hypothetical protein
MRRILFVILAFTFSPNLACHKVADSNQHLDLARSTIQLEASTTAQTGNSVSDTSGPPAKDKTTPSAFREIDFKNSSYPISGTRPIRLKSGKYEFTHHKALGNGWLDFKDVKYFDLTADDNEEALVHLVLVSCGGSCDGGSDLFYVYSIQKNRLTLLWRIEMGSLAYGCGLRSLDVRKGAMTIEGFRVCKLRGTVFETIDDSDAGAGKFTAAEFTRFQFEVKGRKLTLKKHEVLPNPQPDVKNYQAKISIEKQ